MKKILIANCLLLVIQAHAANQPVNSGESTQTQTPYIVVERGLNNRVWAWTNYDIGPQGQHVPHIHKYTELATGMYHENANGQLVESKAEIAILPNGTGAAATNGQHKVIFPADIYNGQIELCTPNNMWLRSRVLGLSYYDTSSGESALIAELTNSVGEVEGDNVVVYKNAFTDLNADVRYTYTIGGFEQDIILHQQPPSPGEYGLRSETTRLQVLTEYFDDPKPEVHVHRFGKSGELTDSSLKFDQMEMDIGKAFLFNEDKRPQSSINLRVAKSWQHMEGRTFLVEELPVQQIEPLSADLPQAKVTAIKPARKPTVARLLPRVHLDRKNTNVRQMAKTGGPNLQRGLVLDYIELNGVCTNLTLQGDTTYFISSPLDVYNLTIEGGAVVKLTNSASLHVFSSGQVVCKTGPYNPAIFTAIDDNDEGEGMGSGGPVTGYYGTISIDPSCKLENLRFLYLSGVMLYGATNEVRNVQMVNVQDGFYCGGTNVLFDNLLVDSVSDTLFRGSDCTASVINMTADHVNTLVESGFDTVAITNSLLMCVTNTGASFAGAYNASASDDTGIFQSAGNGNFYLPTNSVYRDAGTAGIDPESLANLADRTTYPPSLLSNLDYTNDLTLAPSVPRDNDTPDLGYHYDSLDYACDSLYIDDSILTVLPGVCIAGFDATKEGGTSITVVDGGKIAVRGDSANICRIVSFSSVQEQPEGAWGSSTLLFGNWGPTAMDCRFTAFYSGFSGNTAIFHEGTSNVVLSDCQMFHCWNVFYNTTGNITNCLFDRVSFGFGQYSYGTNALQNDLFRGGSLAFYAPDTNVTCVIRDNVFDGTSFWTNSFPLSYIGGHNAYLTNCTMLFPAMPGDIIMTNSPSYETGPLGYFYYPPDSSLIDAGDVEAGAVGLSYYTTETNELLEAGSTVDVGFHYVALSPDGIPISLVISNVSQNQNVLGGSNVTFSVDVPNAGIQNVSYQWLFNGHIIYGATNASLTFTNVTLTDAGFYNVVVAGYGGATITSPMARLNVWYPGSVRAWGETWENQQTAVPAGLTNVVAISASIGNGDTLALNGDRTIVGWGDNSDGQINIPAGLTNAMAVAAGAIFSVALNFDGTLEAWGDNSYGETNLPAGLSNVVEIAAGYDFGLALKADGSVVAWGDDGTGQTDVPAGLSNVVAIAAGGIFSMALTSDGSVVAWGDNNYGETALTSGLTNIAGIAAGYDFGLAINADGTVTAWGDDWDNQTNVPAGLTNVISVSAGNENSLALKNDLSLVGWGGNSDDATNTPRDIGLQSVVAVGSGGYWFNVALCAVDFDGNGLGDAWERQYFGNIGVDPNADSDGDGLSNLQKYQLGMNPWELGVSISPPGQTVQGHDSVTMMAAPLSPAITNLDTSYQWFKNGQPIIGATSSTLTLPDAQFYDSGLYTVTVSNAVGTGTSPLARLSVWYPGSVWAWADGSWLATQTAVPRGLTNAVAISSTYGGTLALKSDGTVVGWGDDSDGQLDVPSGLTNVISVATGEYFSMALKNDGTVVGWGDNGYGETNIPSGLANIVSLAGGFVHVLALKDDGTVVGWGGNWVGQSSIPPGLSNVVAIAACANYSMALKADGTVVAWGDNNVGQTNVPDGLNNVVAIAAGFSSCLALKNDGTVVAWGDDSEGQTNVPAGLNNVVAIASGYANNLALRDDFTVVAWGDDGIATNVPPALELQSAVAVSAGDWFGMALYPVDYDGNGLGDSWERQYFGHIGVDPNADSDGDGLSNLQKYQLGMNPWELGIRISPTVQTTYVHSNVTLTAVALSPVITNLPTSYQWQWNGQPIVGATNATLTLTNVQIAQAGNYSVSVSNSVGTGISSLARLTVWGWPGLVTAWGGNWAGQTNVPDGLSNVVGIAGEDGSSLALLDDGTITGWGYDGEGEFSGSVGLSNVVAIAGGNDHGVALMDDGTVAAWGYDSDGQTNVPAGLVNVVSIAAGYNHCLALENNGTIVGWGDDSDGEIDIPADLTNAVAIAAGGNHSLALRQDRTVEAWGDDGDGQSDVPAGLTNVVGVAAGGYFSAAAIRSDGSVVVWTEDNDDETNVPVAATNVIALAAGDGHLEALKNDGTVLAWGGDWDGQTNVPPGLTNVVAIGAGEAHSLAVTPTYFDENGLPYSWEQKYFGHIGVDPYADPDGDGIDNLQEYLDGTDPTDYYNGALPLLSIVSGNNQTGTAGGILPLPLEVLVTTTNGVALSNAPVTFTVLCGSVSTTTNGIAVNSIQVRTDGNGYASVYFTIPTNSSTVIYAITATVSTVENNSDVTFFESTPTKPMISVGGNLNTYQPSNFLLFLNSIGQVYGLGNNADYGQRTFQLGTDDIDLSADFLNVSSVSIIVQISANEATSYALDNTGHVWAWGNDGSSELGDGSYYQNPTPSNPIGLSNVVAIASRANHAVAEKADGTVWEWGSRYPSWYNTIPTQVTNINSAIAVSAGYDHGLALMSNGSVYAWGNNGNGELGNGTYGDGTGYDFAAPIVTLSNIAHVVAGEGSDSFAVDSNGVVWAWGYNGDGELGTGNSDYWDPDPNPTPISLPTNIVQIATGDYQVIALGADGTMWSWGGNYDGELGIGSDIWGTDAPAQIVAPTNIVWIAAEGEQSYALGSDGTLWWWGIDMLSGAETNVPVIVGHVASNVPYCVPHTPPSIYFQSPSQAVAVGDKAILSVTALGGGLYYKWYFNSSVLIGATNATLSLDDVQTDSQGAYFVVISNALGCITNTASTLTVNAQQRLGYWRFNTPDLAAEGGQTPINVANVTQVPDWSGDAVLVDSTDSAYLWYNVVEANGYVNLNPFYGSVRFWFKPDWTSGEGPGSTASLLVSQPYYGLWWGLSVDPTGTTLSFSTITNIYFETTNLSATVDWTSNQWHQVVLTYSSTNSALYLDGQLSAMGGPVMNLPYTQTYNSFGMVQPQGQFDELETFNYPLSAGDISTNYAVTFVGPPSVTLSLTNANLNCLVTMQETNAEELASSVDGTIFPNSISMLIAGNYADSVKGLGGQVVNIQSVGINISKLPPPVVNPSYGYFNYPSNIVISFGVENLTNMVTGLYRIELGRDGSSTELLTVTAYAQGLRDLGFTDEDVRTNLINGTYFRNSAEYAAEFGGRGDVYIANTNCSIEYSLDCGVTWTNYTGPIQITNSATLLAVAEKSESSDARTRYAYLASDAARAHFEYIPASWLTEYFGTGYQTNPQAAPTADLDHDGLNNLQEYQDGTNPTNADTDGDGINDGQEVAAGTDPLNGNVAPLVRLGYWRFNTTAWLGEEGQVPFGFTNIANVPDWSSYGLEVDTNVPAYLNYSTVQTNGDANIAVYNGSVRFWFKPDWNSATTNGGSGPGNLARLVELGTQGSSDGWWTLALSPDGTQLDFITATNGAAATNVTATISWSSNDWHQLVFGYSATNSTLYVDGQPTVTNGLGVTYWPDVTALTGGFFIGSDNQGNNQARGQFDELETFNYPLTSGEVSSNYNLIDPSGTGPVDYIQSLEGRNPLVHGAAVPDSSGIVNLQIYTPLH